MELSPFSATLKNGQRVLIREVTPHDRHLLEIGYEHLSNKSRYFRFHATHNDLTTSELDVFTATNSPDHVAIGAIFEGPAAPKPVGIARYVRLSNATKTAEIAITIADDYQRQGLGNLLLGVLAKCAQKNGICEFRAMVHSKNTPMLCLLARLGGTQTSLSGAEVEVSVPITSDHVQHLSSPTGTAFRKTFESANFVSNETI